MIKEFEGNFPDIDANTFIAEGGMVVGKVKINEFSSIWHNAVIRGDVNRIEIGRYSNIQDNSVVHVADRYPTLIGDFVTVGHGAIIHGCTIDDYCLIGINAVILDGAVVGRGSIVAAGAVVKGGQIIPPHSLVAGVPAKVVKNIPDKIKAMHNQALKYKTLWTERYGVLPDAGGERYEGGEIV
ncbi:MAG TPA: gamma carbonic anhydrase family protein [Tissierellaceae bacterium]|nr:gamma carbonic anhydrase family protein [Tissierellaceae bacterium]